MKYPVHRQKCHCEHDKIELKCPMDEISITEASTKMKQLVLEFGFALYSMIGNVLVLVGVIMVYIGAKLRACAMVKKAVWFLDVQMQKMKMKINHVMAQRRQKSNTSLFMKTLTHT